MNNHEACQLLLNISVSHVRKQGKAAFDETTNRCEYKTADGLMCGAGIFLINPETVRNTAWQSLVEHKALNYSDVTHPEAITEYNFVGCILQKSHDRAAIKARRTKEDFLTSYHLWIKNIISGYNEYYHMNLIIPK